MKKTITDFNLKNKRVLIRVDFNVPMKNGVITDDNRIKESLKTIQYAIDNGAKVILLSHLGRIKEESDLEKNSLAPVAIRLEELLDCKVTFVESTRGPIVESVIGNMKEGDVVLLQNTRYEDLYGKLESSNDEELGSTWASLGDLFINDAFGTCHRAHASNVGIASHLPSGLGFLVEKEVENLSIALENKEHPFTVILGGAKVSDKVGVIETLGEKADFLLIGGAMAYTFLKAKGIDVKASLVDEESLDFCLEMLEKYKDKIVLPVDSINAKGVEDINSTVRPIDAFEEGDMGLDIGPKTISLFQEKLEISELVVWNGTLGYSEVEAFSHGTRSILETLGKSNAIKIIGGGDTAAAAITFGYKEDMTHISTGGGASLEFLEGKELPGIASIEDKDE